MKRNLQFEVFYPHPPEKVWRALTDSRAIAQWLMKNDFEPRVGHTFQLRAQPRRGWDGVVNCEVLECDPPRRLAYSWCGGSLDTRVTFTLEPAPEGTRLVLEHTGFRGLRARMIGMILSRGWNSKILRVHLPAMLERMDAQGNLPTEAVSSGCHTEAR